MKRSLHSRVLSVLMALVMVFSVIPTAAFAAAGNTATWTKVDLADIAETDTVMITMTNPSGVTYALDATSTSKNPARVVTVEGTSITTADSASYGWTIKATEGGYHIMQGDKYLYLTNDNNGVRVGTTVAVWTLDGNYLKSTDGSNNRWLGVYDNNSGDYSAVASPNWRAYKNTTGNTKNQTVGFWKLTDSTSGGDSGETPMPDPETPTGTEYVKADTIADGDKVVIYNAGSGTAMSSAKSNYNLAGVSVTPADDKIVTEDASLVWTVSVKDGKYTFSQGDKVLGAVKSGNHNNISTNAADGHTAWTLSKGTADATWYVKNDTYPASNYGPFYLEYYNGYTVYASNSPSDNQYGFVFYKIPSEPAEPTYTKSELIADGDKVVIYNAGSGTAMSSAKSGYKLAAVSLTPADDKIVTADEAVVWTVSVKDGKYTFSQGDKVLGAVKSGTNNNLSLNAADGYTTWVLEKGTADATWYVKNDTYPAGSYGPYYLEYYTGYTLYGSNSPSDAAYGFMFYRLGGALEEETPDTPDPDPVVPEGIKATLVTNVADLTEGDELVIVAPSKTAIMGPSAGNYYASVTDGVTLSSDNKTVYFDESKTQTLILGKGTIDGSWSFKAGSVYLAATTGTSNYLKNEASLSANSSWMVSINADGIATVKSNTSGTKNWIRYNPSSPRFSCYSSGQSDVAIYKVERQQYAKLDNTIADGDRFVVYYNKGSMVMSDVASGNKLTGVAATPKDDFILVEDGMSVLTADVDANGHYTFTNSEGKYLTSGATGNSLTFANAASDYSLWTIKAVTGGVHIVSVNAKYNGNAQALEIYNNLFTTFNEKDQDYYLFNLYKLTDETPASSDGLPAAGDKVVIYNLSAKGVLAAENDTQSIENVAAEIKDGKAIPSNGGVVFTAEKNGEYFRFYNETYGYLCSNGTGNNAFYTRTASEDADWTLEALGGGYKMLSRVAKYNGTSAQYLEYYADSYKTYSFYATNKDGSAADTSIYEFYFYPVADGVKLTGDIVNEPAVVFGTLADAFAGADYTFSFTVDAAFGVKELTVTVNGEVITANEDGTYTIPAEKITSTELAISVEGKDNKDVAISGSARVTVKDEPSIGAVTPAAGSQTLENKKPVISAEIINAGENAAITMTVNGDAVEAALTDGILTYTPVADMANGRTTVTVTVVRADGKETAKTWSFTVGKAQYELYFGQLHSHTTYSDGSGSLESALQYIQNLPDSANVDFVAFTDHSNYFDASGAANPEGALYDMSLATTNSQKLWGEYKDTIAKFNNSQGDVIAIGGFEMTWSGGPGHINTFNTPGIVSRNNTTLNNKTSDAGMKAYYALLSQSAGAESINQFNHPGATFGTFTDFAYWDALIDTRIQLVEVGNGEGQVGAGGYFPSYEYYTMALDKGWHVAPTNNQDNHKGKWGNANDARDVILTDDFSEQGLYQAIHDMRVYSTEDKNLEIGYSVNGMLLGSTIAEVPEKLNVDIVVYDPDSSDSISKVELIVNSGKVAYTWDDPADLADGALSATLSPDYSYYYVRVTQGDGDLAVTAPVWVGEMLKLGISSVECGTSTPVTNEEVTIKTTLFNSESANATVKSLTYTTDGSVVIGTDTTGYTIPASGTASVNFKYTPTAAKMTKVSVTAVVEQDGKEYEFSMDVTLDVQDASKLVYVGIDASHYNEYVSGNYKDSMGNFSALAAEYNVRTVQLNTSAELIAACSNPKFKAIVLTAPSRRLAAAQTDPRTYSADELAALDSFNKVGGMLILAGWSDNYENYDVIQNNSAIKHMAETQNEILAKLGSSLRIADDATYDDVRSAADGVEKWRLYFNTYGESFLTEGVEVDAEHPYNRLYTEVFSHYGGASVYTADGTLGSTVTPVVFGHSSTYSVDVDTDGLGGSNVPKYAYAEGDNRLMVMATEQLEGRGLIIVSGAAFLSNFEVQATIEDSGSEKNYSNYKICENLLAYINPVTVTSIAEVQAQTEAGYKYTIEGIVTSNASGYDKDTAFFDCIYVQDETGGVCCFPVAGNFKIGDKVRVTGTTEFYQGEMELQVTAIEKIGEDTVEAKEVTAAQVNDKSVLGQLITVKGTVESFELANGLVQTIMVKDAKGDMVRVFIDGYITIDEDVKNLKKGCKITVTGLASYDDTFNAPEGPFPRIRVRDRADVVCTAAAPQTGDSFHMSLWLSLMALTAAAALVLFSRKNQEQF